MPNWLHLPVGYNGRASRVVVSGTGVRRPVGQTKPQGSDVPMFGPCRKLHIELELGAIVGTPSRMGSPITTTEAEAKIFGYVLLNDWSARDIQTRGYERLGPFRSRAFATSVSPWIVTRDAPKPFCVPTPARVMPLLPYLQETKPNNFDIDVEITLRPERDGGAMVISRTNAKLLYYSLPQRLTHHAIGGGAMCTGDLLGSGTISGPTRYASGSLLEITWNGAEPMALDGGGTRSFVEDGDTLILRGWCKNNGVRIEFGECLGKILPAPSEPQWRHSAEREDSHV